MSESSSSPEDRPGEQAPERANVPQVSFDDLISEAQIPSVTFSQTRSGVARFITKWLIYLFALQIVLFIYLFGIQFSLDNSQDVQTRGQLIIEAAQTILPFTTGFLGVAVGFYFRELPSVDETSDNSP